MLLLIWKLKTFIKGNAYTSNGTMLLSNAISFPPPTPRKKGGGEEDGEKKETECMTRVCLSQMHAQFSNSY